MDIQKRLGKQSDGIHYDIENYSPNRRYWIVSMYRKYSTGYVFKWDTSICGRGVGQKDLIIYGDPNNTNGHYTWIAARDTRRDCPVVADGVYNNVLNWSLYIDVRSGCAFPPCGSQAFTQTAGYGSLDPVVLGDNVWRRFTYVIRKETSCGAGDGLVQLFIAGVPILHRDGLDPSNPAFGICYTGIASPFMDPYLVNGIFNAGSPQAQSNWHTDLQVYYVTGV